MKYFLKKLVLFLVMNIVSTLGLAYGSSTSTIVAVVNNTPITSYEFQNRKMLINLFSKNSYLSNLSEDKVNYLVLENLIGEELLTQYSKRNGENFTESEVDEAMVDFEIQNNLPERYIQNLLHKERIDIDSFRAQLKSKLIRSNILSNLSQSLSISPREISNEICFLNQKIIFVNAKVFISKKINQKHFKKMCYLEKKLKENNCEVKESLYKNFATVSHIKDNLNNLDIELSNLLLDLDQGKTSGIIKNKESFKVVCLCGKSISSAENEVIVSALINKILFIKAQKLFEELQSKAYIRRYLY